MSASSQQPSVAQKQQQELAHQLQADNDMTSPSLRQVFEGDSANPKEKQQQQQQQNHSRTNAWLEFLQAYASGQTDVPPDLPAALKETTPGGSEDNKLVVPSASFHGASYFGQEPTEVTSEAAIRIRDFYDRYNFLPPPYPPHDRLKGMREAAEQFNLAGPAQSGNLERAMHIIGAMLPWASFVNFSYWTKRDFSKVTNGPPYEKACGADVPAGTLVDRMATLCGHAILRQGGEISQFLDLQTDWRFQGNPFVRTGFANCYVGVPVAVTRSDLQDDDAASGPQVVEYLGVINIFAKQTLQKPLLDKDVQLLHSIRDLLQSALRTTFAAERHAREIRHRGLISHFLSRVLEKPALDASSSSSQGSDATIAVARAASELLHKELRAERVDIVNLSQIHQIPAAQQNQVPTFVPTCDTASCSRWAGVGKEQAQTPTEFSAPAMCRLLSQVHQENQRSFNAEEFAGCDFLGPSTTEFLVNSGFIADQPCFVVIVSWGGPVTIDALAMHLVRTISGIFKAHLVNQRVREADQAKTTFLSTISHELRTPLHGLLGQLDLLREALKENQPVEPLLQTGEACGAALQQCLNDLLDFGRLASDRPMLHSRSSHPAKQETELDTLVESIIEDAYRQRMSMTDSSSNGQGGPQVSMHLEIRKRPRGSWKTMLEVASFRRVLANLLSNAIKYTDEGTIRVVLAPESDATISVSVTDTGVGMDEAFLPKLFSAFTRAKTSSAHGTGLGLHISQELARKALRGSLTCTSTRGQGSTFKLAIPVKMTPVQDAPDPVTFQRNYSGSAVGSPQPSPTIEPPPRPTSAPTATSAPLPVLRVLIADDNAVARRLLMQVALRFKAADVQTEVACDGEEAVEKFRHFQPHLVWTDVSMPNMDGVTAVAKMRDIAEHNHWHKCYILVITGLGGSDPRLSRDAVLGTAKIDEWRVKGKLPLSAYDEDLQKALERLKMADESPPILRVCSEGPEGVS